ncbi:hypothetical protein [Saccharothrix variisporea]|uniref:Uncharacterized protein n=1 Tax=Saccharothrix variisporea TaxID=543527 RepID=A0A495XEH9_9PSEU|nr:hypothetical protein [Saccharothrix variisporea]RKT72099.1 hypothetical protein DFJ66_5407 [Saccharothrix variisporea]
MTSDDHPAAPPVPLPFEYRPARRRPVWPIVLGSAGLALVVAVSAAVTFGSAALSFTFGDCVEPVSGQQVQMRAVADCGMPRAVYVVAAERDGRAGCPQGDYVATPDGRCLALRVKAGDCLRVVPYGASVQAYALGWCERPDKIVVEAVHDSAEAVCSGGVRHRYSRPARTVCLSG